MNYSGDLWGAVIWCLFLWGLGAAINRALGRPFLNWRAVAGGSLLFAYGLELLLVFDGHMRNPADTLVTHFLFYAVPGVVFLIRGDKWRKANPPQSKASGSVRAYGIYDSAGTLLPLKDAIEAVTQFDRTACDGLLRAFGQPQSSEMELIDALRLRSINVLKSVPATQA